jgi:hypothetical protein
MAPTRTPQHPEPGDRRRFRGHGRLLLVATLVAAVAAALLLGSLPATASHGAWAAGAVARAGL